MPEAPLLCCVALVTGLIGAAAVSSGLFSRKSSDKNRYQQILEEDGFVHAMNYAWLPHGLGHTLTTNELFVEEVSSEWDTVALDEYGEEQLYADFVNLKALGFNVIGFWGSVYGEGVIFDEHGNVLGVKEEYLVNLRRYMEVVKRADVDLLYIVHAHSESSVDYYGKRCWDVISQMYSNPEVTEDYIEKFVRPVLQVLADYTDNIALVSAGSEPENEINDSELGNHSSGDRSLYGVDEAAMLNFLRRINETVGEELPGVARTIVSNSERINKYNDFDLDVAGINAYRNSADVSDPEVYRSTHPMMLTEWGLGQIASEESFQIKTMQMMENIEKRGYVGSVWWAYLSQAGQGGNQFTLFNTNFSSRTDFRPLAYSMHYHIMDYRKEYRGVESVIDAPTMFYQSGSGMIEWIASRQAATIDIERSLDGGKTWTKLVEGAEASAYETDYKGTYTDTTLPTSGTVQYRVTAYDAEGNSAVSEPSNEMDIMPPAPELVENGGFETGDLTGWRKSSSQEGDVQDDVVKEGDYALSLEGAPWNFIIQEGIEVEANTKYEFSYWYKRHDGEPTSSNGYTYIRLGSTGTEWDEIAYSSFLNASNNDWTKVTMTINTGENTKMAIDFRNGENADYSKFYIDGVSLKEIR